MEKDTEKSDPVEINTLNEFLKIIKKTYKKSLVAVLIVLIISLLTFSMFEKIELLLISPIFLSSYIFYIYNLAQKQFMKSFGELNGFVYSDHLMLSTLSGRLFDLGHSQRASCVLLGKYKNYPIRFFNYSYSLGEDRNEQTFNFTVCEVKIQDVIFPYIVLKSKTMWSKDTSNFSSGVKKTSINLESEFSRKYILETQSDYEIEALQIFTKDLLSELIKEGSHFSIEFYGDKFYIYDDKIIRTQKEMDTLYRVIKMTLDKSGELMIRLKDDFEALHSTLK